MDILAARKKAAEKAKAHHADRDVRPEAAAGQTGAAAEQGQTGPVMPPDLAEEAAELLAEFPPLPDTSFVPDELEPALEPSPVVEKTAEASTVLPAVATENAPTELIPAREPNKEPEQHEQDLEMLSFLLGTEEYVVPVEQVREILTPKEITPVPHTADYLIGVCSLRGTVMPVIDLSRRLGLAAGERDEKSRIIVISLGPDDQVGLFVDRVRGVVRFLLSSVRPAPDTVEQGAGAEFLKGIARKDDRLYILLDVEKAVGA
jgi:purine-binding chemotaxis protein CheW